LKATEPARKAADEAYAEAEKLLNTTSWQTAQYLFTACFLDPEQESSARPYNLLRPRIVWPDSVPPTPAESSSAENETSALDLLNAHYATMREFALTAMKPELFQLFWPDSRAVSSSARASILDGFRFQKRKLEGIDFPMICKPNAWRQLVRYAKHGLVYKAGGEIVMMILCACTSKERQAPRLPRHGVLEAMLSLSHDMAVIGMMVVLLDEDDELESEFSTQDVANWLLVSKNALDFFMEHAIEDMEFWRRCASRLVPRPGNFLPFRNRSSVLGCLRLRLCS
jgi:hypothetical protein